MRTAVADPMVGRVLEGRYRLGERLARGGMSTVYLAQDLRLERAVAVKLMTSDLSADPAFTDRFAREARAAARLAHLNVVAVYDQGNDGGHVFLVMELVRGSTVRDLVTDRGALPLALAIAVMEPMLAALAAAHRAGLVHRDVKPENVLLSDDGLVKVADFGLARAVEADPTSTRTNLMMGTVAYCSPEHVTSGRADSRSDVYSAGVVLFELLTGRVPYVGGSAVQVAYQHVHSRVPAPSSRVAGIPEQIDDLVVRATDPDPAIRPADAGAFLAELHELRSLLRIPVTALPTGTGRARQAAAGAAAGTAVVGAPGVPAPGAVPVRTARPTDTTDTIAAVRDLAPVPAPGRPQATTSLAPAVHADTEWTGGWGHGAAPSSRAAVELPPPPTTGGPGADWPARRRRRRRRALVIVLVLLVLGAAIGYGSWWYAAGRWAAVPDVVGRSNADATTLIQRAGFDVDASPDQAYSETVPAGDVVATDPTAGRHRVHGSTISMTLSRGQERFQLPATTGLTQAAAAQALSTVPVTVASVTANSDTVRSGLVISSDPPAGTEVKRGATVTLSVSAGPPILPVPDVTDQPQAAATTALQGAGFTVAAGEPQFSDTVPSGAVISQTPSGGATAVKFSTVTIVVSRGVDLVAVPSVSNGTSVGTATATLQAAGFQVRINKQYGGLLGVVVAMDPKAGTQLKRGSTVTLTVV